MILVSAFRNKQGDIYSFLVENHGESIVCAAVSALALNTVNSIEAFCGDILHCEYDDDGGFLRFSLPDLESGKKNHDATLLLNSLLLGLNGIKTEHPQQILIKDI